MAENAVKTGGRPNDGQWKERPEAANSVKGQINMRGPRIPRGVACGSFSCLKR